MLATLAEQRLSPLANVLLVEPRVVQQVIKAQLDLLGFVPHARCYAIRREALLAIADRIGMALDLGAGERPWLVLVARSAGQRGAHEGQEELERIVRAGFHALVHAQLEERERAGLLDDAALRERIRRIGRTEFEQLRATFRRDDQLLPPGSDREVYREFCATYLELRVFAPALLITTFPGLAEHAAVEQVLAEDVRADELLSEAARSAGSPRTSDRAEAELPVAYPPVSSRTARGLLRRAERALRAGRPGYAALLASPVSAAASPELSARAQAVRTDALSRLSDGLEAALRAEGAGDAEGSTRWRELLELLCAHRGPEIRVGRAPADRAVLALQSAVRAFEQPGVLVDVPSWILSWGRRAIVRPRGPSRELEIARGVDAAVARAESVALPASQRARVTDWLEQASARADANLRRALRPSVRDVLQRVGVEPISGPEREAHAKLVEELLDEIAARGFSSLPQLRDAISRNEAKLGDVAPRAALWSGDPLLRADAELEHVLDGIYRRGDIYVRALQRASSLCFGNRVGRAISLYAALPALGSFTLLEAVRHLVSPVLGWFGRPPIEPLTWTSFLLIGACIFALVHSASFRVLARELLELTGVVLAWLFLRLPRALLRRPLVRRWLAHPAARRFARNVLVPALLAAITALVLRIRGTTIEPFSPAQVRVGTAFAVFLTASLIMASRVGWWLENAFVDYLAPTWQALSRQWLPQLIRAIGRAFSLAMDGLERAMRAIDHALRFQRTGTRSRLVLAGALGCLWTAVAYVVRLYVTLLVEPELNPLKHFPVVTVAHKLILPFLPDLLRSLEQALQILGPIVGGTLAGVTVFLLPSVFGFLAWELKENYRLYRATRAHTVGAARLGPDGETMHGLLLPGIHSGTLPKLYDRLRRAAQRREEQLARSARGAAPPLALPLGPELGRFRERLRRVERAVRRCAERELLASLSLAPSWRQGPMTIEHVALSANHVRVGIAVPESGAACELSFEHVAGWLVARISAPGFVAELDGEQAALFENALAVFYHRAEVALVREQLASQFGPEAHLDIVEDGIVVWPDQTYQTEIVYKLRRSRPGLVKPKSRRAKLSAAQRANLPVLDTRRVVFAHQPIAWEAWTEACEQSSPPRLLSGPSILPPRG